MRHFILLLFALISIDSIGWEGDVDNFTFNEKIILSATNSGQSMLYKKINYENKWLFKSAFFIDFNPSNQNYLEFFFGGTNDENEPDFSKLNRFRIGESGNDDALVWIKEDNGSDIEKLRVGEGALAEGGKIQLEMEWLKDTLTIYLTAGESFYKSTAFLKLPSDKFLMTGFLINYTSSNTSGFWINSFNWEKWFLDNQPPQLSKVPKITNKAITLNFDNRVGDFELISLYCNNELKATTSNVNQQEVVITFENELDKDTEILGKYFVSDEKGNYDTLNLEGVFGHVDFKDLIITEVMLNPSPPVSESLNHEYIELYNASQHYINLNEIQFIVRGSVISLPNIMLPPQKLAVISKNILPINHPYLIEADLPNLLNSGVNVEIRYRSELIDFWNVQPNNQNIFKSKGGWSLIRNTNGSCTRNKGSYIENSYGGSPGKLDKNEVASRDENPIQQVFYVNDSTFKLSFFEPWSSFKINDSKIKSNATNLKVLSIEKHEITFKAEKLKKGVCYPAELIIEANDCWGNQPFSYSFNFGIPTPLIPEGVIFNEIRCHSIFENNEYVELYVAQNGCINLSSLALTKMDNQEIIDFVFIGNENEIACNGEHKVITNINNQLSKEFEYLIEQYLSTPSGLFTLVNSGMEMALVSKTEEIIDHIKYTPSWHHSGYLNADDIALENKNYSSGGESQNWSSAVYHKKGTPGKVNSILDVNNSVSALEMLSISELMIPNNNGFLDHLSIKLGELNGEYTLSTEIFDGSGNLISQIFNHRPVTSYEELIWDGKKENGVSIPPGIYIAFCRLTPQNGDIINIKQSFTVN